MTLPGPLWATMDLRPRRHVPGLRAVDVPLDPGVYAWYRDGRPVYVGKAAELRDRVWSRHLGRSRTLGTSAFRRNVAEHLGFGAPDAIKAGAIRLDPGQLAAVRAWIEGCEVAWITCRSEAEAITLETAMKAEWLPPLTKR